MFMMIDIVCTFLHHYGEDEEDEETEDKLDVGKGCREVMLPTAEDVMMHFM